MVKGKHGTLWCKYLHLSAFRMSQGFSFQKHDMATTILYLLWVLQSPPCITTAQRITLLVNFSKLENTLVTTAYYRVPLVTRSQLDIKEANHLKLSLSLSILLKLYSRSTIWNHIQYYSLPVNSLYHHFPWLDSIRAAEDRRRQSISCDSRKWFINYQTWILQPSCTVQYYKVILYAYKHGIIKKGQKKWSLPKKKKKWQAHYSHSTTVCQQHWHKSDHYIL